MLRTSVLFLFALFPLSAIGQTAPQKMTEEKSEVLAPSIEDDELGISKGWKLGNWRLGVAVGVNGSLTDNSKKVGAPAGGGFNIGGRFSTFANLKAGNHEWRNNLGVNESFSKSPNSDPWIKGTDEFSFSTWYIYSWGAGMFGLFTNFNFVTNLVPTEYVEGETVTFQTVDDNNNPVGAPVVSDRITLAPSFSPFFLRQSAGLKIRPLLKKWMRIELFPGFLVQEHLARSSKTYVDYDEDANTVTLINLDDFINGGPSFAASFAGSLFNDLIQYELDSSVMYSVFRKSDIAVTNNSWTNNINFDSSATVALQLASWLSLNYELSLRHFPEVLDGFQVSHDVFLTFSNPFETGPSRQ